MLSAKAMSDAIRMTRKKVKEEGVENMVDTAALPQMNPQDVLNLKYQGQIEDTLDLPKKSEAPSDPADASLDETQTEGGLKKKMARIAKILGSMAVG